jgi:hypothetical protein
MTFKMGSCMPSSSSAGCAVGAAWLANRSLVGYCKRERGREIEPQKGHSASFSAPHVALETLPSRTCLRHPQSSGFVSACVHVPLLQPSICEPRVRSPRTEHGAAETSEGCMPCQLHTPPTASMINLPSIIAEHTRAPPPWCGAWIAQCGQPPMKMHSRQLSVKLSIGGLHFRHGTCTWTEGKTEKRRPCRVRAAIAKMHCSMLFHATKDHYVQLPPAFLPDEVYGPQDTQPAVAALRTLRSFQQPTDAQHATPCTPSSAS